MMNSKMLLPTAVALYSLLTPLNPACAQGTAFTYSGRLDDGGSPANGSYDLTFTLFNALSGPSQVGTTFTNTATTVSNGLFTVTLDFGSVFSGTACWVEIATRTNGAGSFATLTPRQQLTPTPYAIYAEGASAAGISGTLPTASLGGAYGNQVALNNTANQFAGSFTGNGGGLTNLNVGTLGGMASSNFWQTGGNTVAPGQFLGSTNNQPVEIWANNQRVARLAYALNAVDGYSPNLVFGHSGNYVGNGVVGATIIGGGSTNGLPYPSTNEVMADFGTVVGGRGNRANGTYSVAMGFVSIASGSQSTAMGGSSATGDYATAMGAAGAGGEFSTAMGTSYASATNSTAMGASTASGNSATAMGASTASGDGSTAMGASTASTNFSTAMGGSATASGYASTAIGLLSTAGGYAATSIGYFSSANGDHSFAAGSYAHADYTGDFVWGDSVLGGSATGPDQFYVRAQGGLQLDNSTSMFCGNQTRQMLNLFQSDYGIGVQNYVEYFRTGSKFAWFTGGVHSDTEDDPGAGGLVTMSLDQNGNLGVTGYTVATAYYTSSDRNRKAGLEPVDTKTVLEKVASLPISRWHFTNEVATTHLGPMAQDFHAAFNVGMDDKHIATVDETGVALAAIQGLNQKLEERNAEIKTLKEKAAKVDSLEKRLNQLEQIVQSLAGNK
jgi:hypothetical protein